MPRHRIELAERTNLPAVVTDVLRPALGQAVDVSGYQYFLARRQLQNEGDGWPLGVRMVDETVDQAPGALRAGFTHSRAPSTVEESTNAKLFVANDHGGLVNSRATPLQMVLMTRTSLNA